MPVDDSSSPVLPSEGGQAEQSQDGGGTVKPGHKKVCEAGVRRSRRHVVSCRGGSLINSNAG